MGYKKPTVPPRPWRTSVGEPWKILDAEGNEVIECGIDPTTRYVDACVTAVAVVSAMNADTFHSNLAEQMAALWRENWKEKENFRG